MRLAFLAGVAAAVMAGPALAQNYPARPITMVIPFAAGGPTDVLGRVVAAKMGESLGQQVVVENVTGAGGQTGSKRVADSPSDGYNFVIGTVGTPRRRRSTKGRSTTLRPISLRSVSSPRCRSR
jgi:tripartite-type tricarboxylate transporter receptor subunit TctC